MSSATGPRPRLGQTYLTAGDLGGRVPPMDYVQDVVLPSVPVDRALRWAADILAASGRGPVWPAYQAAVARKHLSHLPRTLGLVLDGSRQVLAPHLLLLLARLSLLHCPRVDPRDVDTEREKARVDAAMFRAYLVTAHRAGETRRARDDLVRRQDGSLPLDGEHVTGLELELAANMLANRSPFAPSVFDRSQRRWVEIPAEDSAHPEHKDLAEAYKDATGTVLADLQTLGAVFWSRTFDEEGPMVRADYLNDLTWSNERKEAVLALVAAPVETLAATVAAGPDPMEAEYDASVFGRFPIVVLGSGELLMVSPFLLVERTMGWLPWWDMKNGLAAQGTAGRKRWAQVDNYVRRCTELHARETLAHLAAAATPPGTLYGENDVQGAYGTTEQNADAAIRWPGSWVVCEISSRTVTQGTASATSVESLLDDIGYGVVEKARQLHSTIGHLRQDEARLTGASAEPGRRCHPVLVTTEGFPLTPPMIRRVHTTLRRQGLLTSPDTAPLAIVDIEALEAVESRGLDLSEQLRLYEKSGDTWGFREWLLRQPGPWRPASRITERWARVFGPALAAFDERPSS